jgi:hypothetical protein
MLQANCDQFVLVRRGSGKINLKKAAACRNGIGAKQINACWNCAIGAAVVIAFQFGGMLFAQESVTQNGSTRDRSQRATVRLRDAAHDRSTSHSQPNRQTRIEKEQTNDQAVSEVDEDIGDAYLDVGVPGSYTEMFQGVHQPEPNDAINDLIPNYDCVMKFIVNPFVRGLRAGNLAFVIPTAVVCIAGIGFLLRMGGRIFDGTVELLMVRGEQAEVVTPGNNESPRS